MMDDRFTAASLDRIMRGEGLTYSNAERFSEENWEEMMVNWSGSKDRIENRIRDLWWDFHALDRIDYIMFGLGFLLGLAVTLMILTLRFAP